MSAIDRIARPAEFKVAVIVDCDDLPLRRGTYARIERYVDTVAGRQYELVTDHDRTWAYPEQFRVRGDQ